MQGSLAHLAGLLVVIAVACGGVWLLFRLGHRPDSHHGPVVGYPPDLFPARHIATNPTLAHLVAIQKRLLSVAAQVPPHSDLAIWLQAFLAELREMMDTAYRVAVITQVYGQPPQLDHLVREIEQLEVEVVAHVTDRLLARDGDTHNELLAGRLATLRLCARELRNLSLVQPPATLP